MKKTKNNFLFLLLILIVACQKKSELDDLSPKSNVFAPENKNKFFVFDSVKTNQYPYAQLFYHVRYDLMPDPSVVSKIVIYRDGVLKFRLSLTQPNVYKPTDLSVYRFTTYNYTFALEDSNGGLSFFSDQLTVYIP